MRTTTAPPWTRHAQALLLLAFVMLVPGRAPALEAVPDFGENRGNLEMYVHRPADFEAGLPLVVALHGCQQVAADFDDETGLIALAEETPFVLLLPQQRRTNNALNCFRWYDTDHNRPGRGESASIAAMIRTAIDSEEIDQDRVFVLGLSAGGAMTAVLLANHPDRFAGGAIVAGVPYGCNRPASIFDSMWYWLNASPFVPGGADASYACGIRGASTTDRNAAEWGSFVRDAADTVPARWPRVSIWQGARDRTVDPDNLVELVEQWADVHGIDADADGRETFGSATRETFADADGVVQVEAWSIGGFGHALPIDENGNGGSCGRSADYVADADLCAVRRIAEFWQIVN